MNAAWLHPIVMMASALIGLAVGSILCMGHQDSVWIEPFLMVMLFLVFLSVDVGKIRSAFKNIRFLSTALCVNFVWTPLFAFVLALVFFPDSIDARTGLIMLLVTPCTDWFLVFTGIAKGNVELSSTILPINLVLQIVLLPLYILLFTGRDAGFDVVSMLGDTAVVLLVPLAAAIVVRAVSAFSSVASKLKGVLDEHTDNLQLMFLCIAICVMFAAESVALMGSLDILVWTLVPLLLFFCVNYFLSLGVARAEGMSFDDGTSLLFTSLARNSPLALAIAVAAFPDSPLTMLMLAIGPLIELPVLSLIAGHRLSSRQKHSGIQKSD